MLQLDFLKEPQNTANLEVREYENIIFIKKFNWEYLDSLEFQMKCLQYVVENPLCKIFIFTSHSSCFTIGRGLQKGLENHLIEHNEEELKKINIPIYKIKRGGGLTYHHNGQWIMYTICNLVRKENSLKKIMNFCLESVKKTLEGSYLIKNLEIRKLPMGLWYNDLKIASIGVGIEKFVTYHGIALNLYKEKNNNTFDNIHPCGLSLAQYTCLRDIIGEKIIENTDFQKEFEKTIF